MDNWQILLTIHCWRILLTTTVDICKSDLPYCLEIEFWTFSNFLCSSCDHPQEKLVNDRTVQRCGYRIVHAILPVGSLVWARMPGHIRWEIWGEVWERTRVRCGYRISYMPLLLVLILAYQMRSMFLWRGELTDEKWLQNCILSDLWLGLECYIRRKHDGEVVRVYK